MLRQGQQRGALRGGDEEAHECQRAAAALLGRLLPLDHLPHPTDALLLRGPLPREIPPPRAPRRHLGGNVRRGRLRVRPIRRGALRQARAPQLRDHGVGVLWSRGGPAPLPLLRDAGRGPGRHDNRAVALHHHRQPLRHALRLPGPLRHLQRRAVHRHLGGDACVHADHHGVHERGGQGASQVSDPLRGPRLHLARARPRARRVLAPQPPGSVWAEEKESRKKEAESV
mmetsp:Transcript_49465/g.120745  ORF Transcript_49465/g.120745 Transcript_49465/m.120745 type:complete len:228 (+) Transcript_49465:927-1610(+)